MIRFIDYIYIFITIGFTIYGQLILKWRIASYGPLPVDFIEKLRFLISLLFDPYIISGFSAAFLASLAWMAALTKFDLSHAYPFMSLSFVLILLLSGWLLNEPITLQKILGISLISFGIIVISWT